MSKPEIKSEQFRDEEEETDLDLLNKDRFSWDDDEDPVEGEELSIEDLIDLMDD